MLGKIVNGILIQPSANEKKKIVITNPTDEILKFAMGYKDLTIDDEPEYDVDTQWLAPSFEETETEIIQHWEVVDMESVE